MIKLLKKYLPKSLYPRTLLILILPTFLAQSIAVYIFYERHWSDVSRHLAASLAGEVATVVDRVKDEDNEADINKFLQTTANLFSVTGIYTDDKAAPTYLTGYKRDKYSYYNTRLRALIGKDFKVFHDSDKGLVITEIILPDKHILLIEVSDKRLFISSSYIFIIWMVVINLLLTTIAVQFLRGQIRPIIKLARLADNFGRGLRYSSKFQTAWCQGN